MKKLFIPGCLFISLLTNAQQHQLVKLWESDTAFKVPESVLYDKANNVLYVSNIDGTGPWDQDGRGSIGKLSPDGKIIDAEWIRGFDAPKGMGLHNGTLYVADLSNLVVVDIASGKIERKIAIPGAAGLNDVTIDPAGIIYVSDSRKKIVFRIENEKVSVFADSLKGPNGVLAHNGRIYLLDAGGMFTVNDDKSLALIADGMDGGTDGIEHIGNNNFIVSAWSGRIWYVNADGTKELLLDTSKEKRNTADIGINAEKKIIYVPTFWKNSVVAFEVKDR